LPSSPTASIAVPTKGRAEYLDVTLASVVPQATRNGAEVLVVLDGHDAPTEAVARRHGARVVSLPQPAGANAARNRAVEEACGELLVFIDDDVEVSPGWLDTLLDGSRDAPDYDVFGGPIRARLEGGGPRACGREDAPITTLDLGPDDRDASFVWSANMAVRRAAFDRAGPFDETIAGRGEEEDWERRYRQKGGRIRYLAGAGLEHRRTRRDATVRALARSGYQLGRSARRNDRRKGAAPPWRGELRTVAGCCWHIIRRRCAIGFVMLAESSGRLREALSE
jgi:glycosyltransferase involved in cell wall biosynthesis